MTALRKEKLWFLDSLAIIHLSARTNADGLSVIEHRVPYGSSPPLHIHHTEDEAFHMLAGTARFVVGGKEMNVKAGDSFVAPKGVPHTYVVTSSEGALWLTITSGGDFESMLRAVSRPAAHDGIPAEADIADAMQKSALDDACRASGIDLVGPPLPLRTMFAAA